jgi:hypothetical protein
MDATSLRHTRYSHRNHDDLSCLLLGEIGCGYSMLLKPREKR